MRKDSNKLRQELEDYYGTAMFNGNPQAMIDLMGIEELDDEKLEQMAKKVGIDINDDNRPYTYKKRWFK